MHEILVSLNFNDVSLKGVYLSHIILKINEI